jgi:hypothetical protein
MVATEGAARGFWGSLISLLGGMLVIDGGLLADRSDYRVLADASRRWPEC